MFLTLVLLAVSSAPAGHADSCHSLLAGSEPQSSRAVAAPPVGPETQVESFVSLDAIKRSLEKPSQRLIIPAPGPIATFKVEVRRSYMPDFREHLHSLFKLTPIQRQSAEWASKPWGINLFEVARYINKASRESEEWRVRQEVAAELEAFNRANEKKQW